MKHEEIARLMESVAPTIADFVVRAVAPLRAENNRLASCLAAMEKRFDEISVEALVSTEIAKALPDVISTLPVPENGKDADPAVIAEMVKAEVAKIERPENGKDADPEVVAALVAEYVEKAFAVITPPHDGKSVTIDDVRPMIEETVKAAVAEMPVPENGKDADPAEVAALIIEDVAKLVPAGKDGINGKDGVGLAGGLLGRNGELVLTLTDGSTKDVGIVVGKDGDRGEPGHDGLGFDDFEFVYDGERTFVLRYVRGDEVKEFPVKMPIVLDRGVYKSERDRPYEKGDGCSFGGSFWIAQQDSPEGKPEDGNKCWRLAVKRGKNGADGAAPKGPVGPVSVPGAQSK